VSAAEPLVQARRRALEQLKRLPIALKRLERGPDYEVTVSDALKKLAQEVDARQAQSTNPDRGEK
jgi:hypothetical protein